MKRKNHAPEQIVRMLQQADVTVARGGTVEQAYRELGISEASSWRIHDRLRTLLERTKSRGTSSFLAFTVLLALAVTVPVHVVWAAEIAKPQKDLPLPGEVFEVDGRTAFVLLPAAENLHHNRPTPWVWYAPTLPGLPEAREQWMFERFLEVGVAVAGVDVGESYGNPQGRAHFSAFYRELTERRGFSRKPALLARSRGGLMLLT